MTGPKAQYAEEVRIVEVARRDPRAVALLDRMDVETAAIYGSLLSSFGADEVPAARRRALSFDPREVRVTLLAIDSDGTALAHAALRDMRGD